MRTRTLDTGSLTWLHWVGIVLAAVTGVVHLALGAGMPTSPLGASFLLAGLGFVGAIALVVIGYRRHPLYLIGIPYTGVQIVLWYAFTRPTLATISPVALLDKAVQVALIAVLVALYLRASGRE